jgi:hypothetical protein
MDGDGADDPREIAKLLEPIRSGRYDFVIGSRARGKREPEASLGTSLRRPSGRLGHAARLRRALHRHVRVPSHQARRTAGLGMREN